jgi:hypothetical protein
MKKKIFTSIFVLIISIVSVVAQSTIRYAGLGQTYPTVQAAINAANDGDIIRINVLGTHKETHIIVNKNVTIEGLGADKTTLKGSYISMQSPGKRAFLINSANRVIIRDMKITDFGAFNGLSGSSYGENGWQGGSGGAINNLGHLDVIRCEFYHNHAGHGGNGAPGAPGADGTDGDWDVRPGGYGRPGGNGGKGGSGGAIANSGTLLVRECLFLFNDAGIGGFGGYGGKGGRGHDGNDNNLNRVSGAHGGNGGKGGNGGNGGNGGAIVNTSSDAVLEIINSTFTHNTASSSGSAGLGGSGGIGGDAASICYISGCTRGRGGGGGNGGDGGNGGYNGVGGAIYACGESILRISNCTIVNNSARTSTNTGGNGGVGGKGGFGVRNQSSGDGGDGGDGGRAPRRGDLAGVGMESSTISTIKNTIIYNNVTYGLDETLGGAGGNGGAGGDSNLANGISGGYTGTAGQPGNNFNNGFAYEVAFIDNDYNNLIENWDPDLLPLDNYGGPTKTYAIPNNSVANNNTFNGGDILPVPEIDQRGFTRNFDGIHYDIGAYEYIEPPTNLVINEVDARQDNNFYQFIELYDGGVGNTPLDEMVVVIYDGGTNKSTKTIDLSGRKTNTQGYFVIGTAIVEHVNLQVVPGFLSGIDNAHAVVLYKGIPANFPNGHSVTLDNIIDALVYDVDKPDNATLLTLLNAGQPQINENENGNAINESMQRIPNGIGGQRNTTTYGVIPPTPGRYNGLPPTLSASVSSLDFGEVEVGATKVMSYTLTGSHLTGNVIVSGSGRYRVSLSNSGFNDFVIIPPSAGAINTTIYVQVSVYAEGNLYNDIISSTSSGATPVNVNVTATGIEPSISTSENTLAFGDVIVNSSSTMEYTLTGSYLDNDVTIASGNTAFKVSLSETSGFAATLAVSPVNGAINKKIYVRFYPTAETSYSGTITNSGNGVTTKQVTVSGTGVSGTISLTTNKSEVNYGNVNIGRSKQERVLITGKNISGSVTVDCPAGKDYKVSTSFSGPFSSSLTFTPSKTNFKQALYVNFSPASNGTQLGTMKIYNKTKEADVTLRGKGVTATITTTPTVLNYPNTLMGDSTVSSYLLKGFDLVDDITVTSSNNNYKVSISPTSGFASSIVVPRNGTSVIQNIFVKFTPITTGQKDGSISNASNLATTKYVYTHGAGVIPSITVSPINLAFGDVRVGDTKVMQYSLQGSNLIDVVLVTPPDGYEVSLFSDHGFSSSLLLAPHNKSVMADIYVRMQPTEEGTFNGSLSNNSRRAITRYVEISGEAHRSSLVCSPASLDFGNVGLSDNKVMHYSLTGRYLHDSESVTISAPTGFGISESASGPFVAMLDVDQDAGTFDVNKTIYVKFAPTSKQTYEAQISNYHYQLTSSPTVTVTGAGVSPEIEVSETDMKFYEVRVGESKTLIYELKGTNLTANVVVSAPEGFSVSQDGTTFSSSITVVRNLKTSSILKKIYVKFSPASKRSYSGNVTNVCSGATSKNIAVSGDGAVSEITVLPASLAFGNVKIGKTSEMSYTVEGTYLTSGIEISAPSGFLVSLTSGSGFAKGISIPNVNGYVNAVVYVQFAPVAETAYFGDVENGSSGVTTKNVAVSGTGVESEITVSPASLAFGDVETGSSSEKSYKLTGTKLKDDITVTAPKGYKVSLTSGSGFAASVDVPQSGGEVKATVYVQFAPIAETAYNDDVTNENADAPTEKVAVTGTGVHTGTPIITASESSIDFGEVQKGTSDVQTFTVEGADLTADITVSVTGTAFETSLDGTTFGTGNLTLSPSGGTVSSTTVYIRFSPTAVQTYSGTVSLTSTGATGVDVDLAGEGVVPEVSVSVASLAFGDVQVGSSSEAKLTLTGTHLKDDVTVTAPAGYKVSLTSGSGFAASVNVPQISGSVNRTVYIQFSPVAETTYNGDVTCESTDASTAIVSVSGTGVKPKISVSVASLAFGDVVVGTTSELAYSITATHLKDDITVTAPAGYKVSLTSGSGFAASIDVPQSGGKVTTTVYVQFVPSSAVAFNGNVRLISLGAMSKNIGVSGTGTPAPNPVIVSSVSSLAFGDIQSGSEDIQSFIVDGSELTGDITVSVTGAEFSISADGTTFGTGNLTLAQSSGAVTSKTIYVKFAPGNAQDYSGTVSLASAGATGVDVALSGTGVKPEITVSEATIAFGDVETGSTAEMSFTVTGVNLTDDVTVIAPAGYRVSLTSGSGFAADVDVPQSGGAVNATIFVEFAPVTESAYNETLKVESTGALTNNMGLTGTGVAAPTPDINGSVSSFDFGNVQASSDSIRSFTVTGTDLTGDITVSVSAAGYQISTDGTTFGTADLTISQTGGTVASATVYVKFAPAAAQSYSGTVSVSSPGAVQFDVALQGEGVVPEITISNVELAFGEVEAGNVVELSYQVTGVNLVDNIEITAPAGFMVSLTSGSGFGGNIEIEQVNGNASATVYVIFDASQIGTLSGMLIHTSSNASQKEISVSADVTTAVAEFSEMEVSVYPNPTRDIVNISISNYNLSREATLAVFNSNGKIVKQINVSGNEFVVDLSGQTDGVYYIRIQSGNHKLTKRIVKMY